MREQKDDNSNYTDGFPVGDDTKKKDSIESRDPSRPFDSGRPPENKDKTYERNTSGTTMNDSDKYKK